jgi:hypothetical protein
MAWLFLGESLAPLGVLGVSDLPFPDLLEDA